MAAEATRHMFVAASSWSDSVSSPEARVRWIERRLDLHAASPECLDLAQQEPVRPAG